MKRKGARRQMGKDRGAAPQHAPPPHRTGKRPSLLSNTSSTYADMTAWPAPSCAPFTIVMIMCHAERERCVDVMWLVGVVGFGMCMALQAAARPCSRGKQPTAIAWQQRPRRPPLSHVQQRLALLGAHADESIVQHEADRCGVFRGVFLRVWMATWETSEQQDGGGGPHGGMLCPTTTTRQQQHVHQQPKSRRASSPALHARPFLSASLSSSPLTVEEVGLARAVGADDAVDLGRERLGDRLVLVALEAIDDHLVLRRQDSIMRCL